MFSLQTVASREADVNLSLLLSDHTCMDLTKCVYSGGVGHKVGAANLLVRLQSGFPGDQDTRGNSLNPFSILVAKKEQF